MFARDASVNAAVKYSADFVNQLKLDKELDQKCQWTCILWLREYWANQAQKSKIALQELKESVGQTYSSRSFDMQYSDSQFLNTVAQVYSRLFDGVEQTCNVKTFVKCPFMGQRQNLLKRGSLATVFVTILQKAVFYSMLERHPLDSGLLPEEYTDVYGIDFTDFDDLKRSLTDGRFDSLDDAVVNRAKQLAGLKS